jgi:hypothetical protein
MRKHKHSHRSLTRELVPRHKDGNRLGLRKRFGLYKKIQAHLGIIKAITTSLIAEGAWRVRPGKIEAV